MLFNHNSAEATCNSYFPSHKRPLRLSAHLDTQWKAIVYRLEDRGQKMTHSCESEDCSLLCCVQKLWGVTPAPLQYFSVHSQVVLLVGMKL